MTSFNHGSRSRYQADLHVRLELCPLSDMASDLQWIKAEKRREEQGVWAHQGAYTVLAPVRQVANSSLRKKKRWC
jgi:hypothetical protein